MGSSCFHCIRSLVVIFNFLFVVIGFTLLTISLYTYFVSFKDLNVRDSGQYENVKLLLYAVMAIGAMTILIGTFGCCGAYHESECLLGSYFVFLFIIFACEMAVGIGGFAFKQEVKSMIDRGLDEEIRAYRTQLDLNERNANNPMNILTNFVDLIQKTVQCCGYDGPHSYDPNKIPKSCLMEEDGALQKVPNCKPDGSTSCVSPFIAADKAFKEGCRTKYPLFIENKLIIIFVIVFSFALFEFLALMVSMTLCCRIHTSHDEYASVSRNA